MTRLQYTDIPSDVVARARQAIIDCIGLSLYVASSTDMGRMICEYALAQGGGREGSTVLGTGRKAGPGIAALANGTLANGFEFEDAHMESYTHPYTTVVPSSLALAEQRHASGKELLVAVVCGYESVTRVGAAMTADERRASAARGWYLPSTHGAFGAGAAAASIVHLDEAGIVNCLGIAGMQACGLMQAHDDGAMARRLTCGRAAEAGVAAALLAERGFTGPPRILEGDHGYFHAIGCERYGDLPDVFADLGEQWTMRHVMFKSRPIAGWCNAPLEALQALHRQHRFEIADIETVDAWQEPASFHGGAPSREFRSPAGAAHSFTTVAAQQSLRFTLATYLVHGQVTVDEYSAEKLEDPRTHDVLQLVRTNFDPDLVGRTPPDTLAGRVVVRLRDGGELAAEVIHPKGTPGNPLTDDEFRQKFMSLAGRAVGPDAAEEFHRAASRLEEVPDVSELLETLSAERRNP
jgi:2-methylcitrate dehydratase PrpD